MAVVSCDDVGFYFFIKWHDVCIPFLDILSRSPHQQDKPPVGPVIAENIIPEKPVYSRTTITECPRIYSGAMGNKISFRRPD
jgi:hypothetical protein